MLRTGRGPTSSSSTSSALSTSDATRWVDDFPADSGRLVVDADGYRAVIVNGEVVLDDGASTGATPGQILRGDRSQRP